MQRLLCAVVGLMIAAAPPALADAVADRAVAAAKDYVKSKNLKEPKLTILLSSLYNNSFPDFAKKWEQLTGVKMEIVPLGYTDIPAKIMQEGVAKTGVYDIFNDFPYTAPDAAGAKVIIPLDSYAAKYKPDFSGVADGLKFQQYHDGKLYIMINDGDHLLLTLRKDLVENPQAQAEYKTKVRQGPRLPGHGRRMGTAGRLLPHRGGQHALGREVREAALWRARLPLDQLLLPALPGLHEGPSVR